MFQGGSDMIMRRYAPLNEKKKKHENCRKLAPERRGQKKKTLVKYKDL